MGQETNIEGFGGHIDGFPDFIDGDWGLISGGVGGGEI